MNYFKSITKYILVRIELSPTLEDGSRKTLSVQEIAKSDTRGILTYLISTLYKDMDNRNTAKSTDIMVLYNVISVQEAKQYREV